MSKGCTVWLTGLPCSGKSTLSEMLEKLLREAGEKVELLDGDLIRTNLSKGLGFSREDRDINIRRVGFVCNLLSRNGVTAIAAVISPYRSVRDEVRGMVENFVEVYVKCSLEVCIQRDVKGMYAKALRGEMPGFTGIDDPYEEPLNPEIVIETEKESAEESCQRILRVLQKLGHVNSETVAP